MESNAERDPRYHTKRVKGMLKDLVDHLREDVGKVDEPRAQALFETSAEVLTGLEKAFEDYDKGSERAWRR